MTKTRLIAHAPHVRTERLAGTIAVYDDNTGAKIGQADVILGFAHYYGATYSAHEGVKAVIRDGLPGLLEALRTGLHSGRDDRR